MISYFGVFHVNEMFSCIFFLMKSFYYFSYFDKMFSFLHGKHSRGHPSLKKSSSKKNIEDSRRYSCFNASTFINSGDFGHEESTRHSSYFQRQPTPKSIFWSNLEYISSIHRTYRRCIGDGNCGFRAISTCLGGHKNAWDNIRRELMG